MICFNNFYPRGKVIVVYVPKLSSQEPDDMHWLRAPGPEMERNMLPLWEQGLRAPISILLIFHENLGIKLEGKTTKVI